VARHSGGRGARVDRHQHQPDRAKPRDVVRGAHGEEARLTTVAMEARPIGVETRQVTTSAVFIALLPRDIRGAGMEVFFFLIRTTMQPLLFMVVFGYLLPKMNFLGRGYQTALLPGILAVSLSLSAIQSVALPMVQDFGWTKEIEDRLLAPVPTR